MEIFGHNCMEKWVVNIHFLFFHCPVNVVFVDLYLVSHLCDSVLEFILFTIYFAPCQFSFQILSKFVSLIMPVKTYY